MHKSIKLYYKKTVKESVTKVLQHPLSSFYICFDIVQPMGKAGVEVAKSGHDLAGSKKKNQFEKH